MANEGDLLARLVLDKPVSVNRLYMPAGRQIILTAAAREWKEYAGWMAKAVYLDSPYRGAVSFEMIFYRAGRHGDTSNLVKVAQDAFNNIIYVDDDQIVDEHYGRVQLAREESSYVEVIIRKFVQRFSLG